MMNELIQWIIQLFEAFPKSIATILLSALPITELRLTIPIAANIWRINPFNVYLLAVIGNLLPLIPLFFGLEALLKFCEKRIPFVAYIINQSVLRAEAKVKEKYAKYGAFALFLFTALPLPFTGLYTATLAAVALKIPFKYAAIGIVSGVLTAGIIVSLLTISVDVFF